MKNIEKIRRILKTKSNLPVLDDLYFKDRYIYLSSIDVKVRLKNPLFNSPEGFFIKADPFLKLTKDMTRPVRFFNHGNSISLTSNGNNIGMKVSDNRHDEVKELFEFSKDKPARSFTMSETDRKMILTAGKFTSGDDLRPVMRKVYYGNRYVCASDAHRMYYPKSKNRRKEILIHEDVHKIMADYVDFTVNEIKTKGTRKCYQLISEDIQIEYYIESLKFPTFQKVIPKQTNFVFEMSKAELIRTLKLFKGFNDTGFLKFELSESEVKITSKNHDYVSAKLNTIPGVMVWYPEGTNSIEIGFRCDFLITIIENLKEDYVRMDIYDSGSGVIFNGYMLLMPMLIHE